MTQETELTQFLARIQSSDAGVRYAAWRAAGPMGAAAIPALAPLIVAPDKGVAKAAKGALETIVHYAARPGANREAQAVAEELLRVAGANERPRAANVSSALPAANQPPRPASATDAPSPSASTPDPRAVRAEALHLVGLVGDGRSALGLAELLNDPDVRDEARMALERIPGSASNTALKRAAKTAGPDFRPALEQSLHNRALTPRAVGKSL